MHTDTRIQELELIVAELADIITHLTWGRHDSNLHSRGFAVSERAQAGIYIPPMPEPVKPVKPVKEPATGRKFR